MAFSPSPPSASPASSSVAALPVSPLNLFSYIETARPSLRPPVGNKLIWGAGQHKVMIVGGPNVRKDYHLQAGEEIFYQVEGDMVLKIIEAGEHKDVPIPQGHILFLPRGIPHSPQRLAGTVGVVLERERLPLERDALIWYTDAASTASSSSSSPSSSAAAAESAAPSPPPSSAPRVLYREVFYCSDLGQQLKPVIERFQASDAARTGVPAKCYEEEEVPITPNASATTCPAFDLKGEIAKNAGASGDNSLILCGPGSLDPARRAFEYSAVVHTGPHSVWGGGAGASGFAPTGPGETWVFQISGETRAAIRPEGAAGEVQRHVLGAGDMLLLPARGAVGARFEWDASSVCMLVTNSSVC